MKLLAINAGSSSLKFKLYEMPNENILVYGYIDRIGSNSNIKVIMNNNVEELDKDLKNHDEAVKSLIDILIENKVINSLDEINAIGHRIVNGAGKYKPELVTEKSLERLNQIAVLSPVHMPGHIAGIKAFQKLLPKVKQVLIYDTAFHHTIPKENFLYPVPYEWYQKYDIRKYGFHGISCKYITLEMEKLLNKKPNLIICHIGSGASITLVEEGKSIDNSMGFTANEGLIMGTRSGNIDYSILPYIMEITGKSIKEIDHILNYESGLYGLSGVSDNRDLEQLMNEGNELAKLANEMYINKIVDFIAKYYLKLNDIDALVLCGGVGENAVGFRKSLIKKLAKLGIKLDEEKNEKISKFADINKGIITSSDSTIPCYVIPTDEELMIARETQAFIK